MSKSKHRCIGCGVSFASAAKFEAHPCVKAAEQLSLEELIAQYQARKKES